MLPEGWTLDTIGRVAKPSKSKYDPKIATEELECIELEHIIQGAGSLNGSAPATSLSSVKTRFLKGDVLFGKLRPYLKKYVMPDFSGVCSTEIWALKPVFDKITSEYLFQIVQSQTFLDAANKSCGTKMPRADWSVVSGAHIALPPLSEQKRIAEVLGSVDAAIEATKAVIDQTKKVKQGLLQTLLKRGIGHTKFKDSAIGEIPESWVAGKLSNIVDVNPRIRRYLASDDDVSFLAMADVSEAAQITNRQVRRYEQVAKGFTTFAENDVLLAKITPCFENGKGALAENLVNGIGFGSTEFHILRAKHNCDPSFVYQHTVSPAFRFQGVNSMTGSAGQQRVPKEFISSYIIGIPPLPEQKRIAEILGSVDTAIEASKTTLTDLQTLKKGLMNDLLTGKVRVDISAKAPVSNVVPFPQHATRTPARKQALLAAEITAQLYDLQKFGVTKREKIMDICDRHIALNERTERRAARREFGSYDEEARRVIDGIFESEDWFKIRTAIRNGHNTYKYLKGSNFRAHTSEFDAEFGDVKSDIQHIIDLLRDLTTQQCEIIDTLYTAWNDLIIERNARNENTLVISEAEIFTEVLSWHPSKGKIPESEWKWGMGWLRQKNLIPTGKGASSKPPVLL